MWTSKPRYPTTPAALPVRPDSTHLVLIPSYNSGVQLLHTVQAARAAWTPVWVVVDGSTDGSADALDGLARQDPGLQVLRLAQNRGKGAAVRHGALRAARQGYTHALIMDADGQHPADHIAAFMARSRAAPGAMVLGYPRFGPDAPGVRVQGRRISNLLAGLETGWVGIGDCLFGFRVYPLCPLLAAMAGTRWMRGFDFDPEAAVRLCWRGVPAVNLPAPVRYLRRTRAGCRISAMGATICCWPGCICAFCWARCFACPADNPASTLPLSRRLRWPVGKVAVLSKL